MSSYLQKCKVKKASEVFKYINQSISKKDMMYHYTSLENLIKIVKGKSIRLTRLDLLNDKAEMNLISGYDTDRNYLMSFCNTEAEYVSMWAIYGKSSGIKIRLGLSYKLLKKSILNELNIDQYLKQSIPIKKLNKANSLSNVVRISDVVYLDDKSNSNNKKSKISHNQRPFKNLYVTDTVKKELGGFLKYNCWEYEKERRIKVTLNEKDCADKKYIYLGLSKDLLDNISITYNPWISEELQGTLENYVNELFERKVDQKRSDLYKQIGEL